jgi:DNA replication protein DnaC
MNQVKSATCPTHGDFESTLLRSHKVLGDSWSECEQCAAEREKRIRTQEIERERKRAAEARQQRLAAAEIPPRFRGKTFDDYRAASPAQERILSIARDYAANFEDAHKAGRCLLFSGKVGAGKTHLACAILQAIIETPLTPVEGWERRRWYPVRYSSASELIRTIRETWHSNTSESAAIAKFVAPDLLVIDEVGLQFGSEAERNQLTEILDKRYQRILPTIIVSNVAKEALPKYLGERAVDRLRENGGLVAVFDWESHRGERAGTGVNTHGK